MITLIFIVLAAICNSIMDCIENEHIVLTIFHKLNPEFWNKRYSWNKCKRIFGFPVDAWHIAKSLMIIFFTLAIVCFELIFSWYIEVIGIGIVWNLTFNLFYNLIFKKKTYE